MTPEVEAELNKIGWKWASRNPWQRMRFDLVFREDAGMVAPSPQLAEDALTRHRELCAKITSAIDGLRTLSDDAVTAINLSSTPVDDRDQGWPDHIAGAASALSFLAPGIAAWTELLEHEAGKARRGGRRNEPVYRIAEAIAEIYVIGQGKKPKCGNRADGTGPSTLYCKVTAAVLRHLGITVSDVVKPCRTVVKGLTEDRMQKLLDWHQPFGLASPFRMARIPRKG